jgi:hypothetical protein
MLKQHREVIREDDTGQMPLATLVRWLFSEWDILSFP